MEQDPDFLRLEDEDTKTAFNSSLDIIQRISRLEYSFIACMKFKDYDGAFEFLRLIYSEIDFKLKDDHLEEIDEFISKLKKEKDKALQTFKKDGRVYVNNPIERELFIENLFELKRVLSKLKYKAGLGMSDMSDPRYALLNG